MSERTLPEILRDPKVAYGTLMVSSHPAFTTAASGCGLDFVFVDTEHVPLDRDELAQMCQTYSALGLPPLVRVPKADPVLARAVMDAGACGGDSPSSLEATCQPVLVQSLPRTARQWSKCKIFAALSNSSHCRYLRHCLALLQTDLQLQ